MTDSAKHNGDQPESPFRPLELPPELQHLVEKREATRRKTARRKAADRRQADVGPAGRASTTGNPAAADRQEQRTGSDRRSGRKRRVKSRRRP